MSEKLEVLVVGAGPTGLTLGCELARRGLRVRVIDKSDGPTTLSKAIAVHARTLEILCDLGIADELEARGVRLHGATLTAGGHTLAKVEFAGLESRYPYILSVAQSETEAVLGGLLQRLGGTVERRTELVSFEQDDHGVVAKLRSPHGEEAVEAAWVAGCDGAHSAVRHTVGASFEGHAYDDTFVLADVAIAGALPAGHISTFFAEDGILACFPMAGDRWRLILSASPDTSKEPALADVARVAEARAGQRLELSDPRWIAPFRINCRQVERYRHGRAFLAGDAAHIHSPAGGQGMNTGIQDAHNLGWKLAYVQRHGGRDLLLESYGAERHAIGKALLRSTDAATKLGTLKSVPAIGVRNLVVSFLSGFEPVRRRLAHSIAELDVAYTGSALGKDFTSLLSHAGHASTRPGSFVPALPGVTGDAITLVVTGDAVDAVRTRFAGYGARVACVGIDAEAAKGSGMADDTVLVVRPDLYIGARASSRQLDQVREYLEGLLA